MSVDFDYRVAKATTLSEVEELKSLAKRKFPEFQGIDPDETIGGYFKPKQLLAPERLAVLNLKSLNCYGSLPIKKDPFPDFREVMKDSVVWAGERAIICVQCNFEEKNSKQTKNYYDSAEVYVRQGRLFFAYSANGSLITKDNLYRREFVQKIAEYSLLPIELGPVNDWGGRPYLHAEGGDIRGMGGDFTCELIDVSPLEAVGILEDFLREFASLKHFEYLWSVASLDEIKGGETQNDICQTVYRMVHEAGFPAQKYNIEVRSRLTALNALDAIQGLCGPKDKVFTEFFSFDLPEEEYDSYAVFSVVTTAAGHELQLTMKRSDKYLYMIEDALGVKFEKCK